MGLGLPPIIQPQAPQDLGISSAIRQTGKDVGAALQTQTTNRQKDEALKQSATEQLLKVAELRRKQTKDANAQAQIEVENIRDLLVSLPEKEAKAKIEELSKDPKYKGAIEILGKDTKTIYAAVKASKRPEEREELKFMADLAKTYDGVDKYVKSGDVNDLTIKTDPEDIGVKGAIRVSIAMGKSFSAKATALTSQLQLATPEEREDIQNQLNSLATDHVTQTSKLFSSLLVKKAKEKGGALGALPDADKVVEDILRSVETYKSIEEMEAELNTPANKATFSNLGIAIGDLKPLLVAEFEMHASFAAQVKAAFGGMEETPESANAATPAQPIKKPDRYMYSGEMEDTIRSLNQDTPKGLGASVLAKQGRQ